MIDVQAIGVDFGSFPFWPTLLGFSTFAFLVAIELPIHGLDILLFGRFSMRNHAKQKLFSTNVAAPRCGKWRPLYLSLGG